MTRDNTGHYEVLGVPADAKHTDIGLAFNRLMAKRRHEDAPPDPKGEAKLREAYAVLGDLDRRAAYDAELRAARLKPAFGRNQAMMAAGFVVAVGAGLFWFLRAGEAPAPEGKTLQELLNAAIPAVGRVQAVDMSGEATAVGIAFAIEEGVLVTSCHGISPTVQLSVTLAPRTIPARITASDPDLGLCKLEVAGAGSWPLAVSPAPPKAGDRVYAAQLNAQGEVVLREARVKRASDAVELSLAPPPAHGGAPVIDVNGRVVAVASVPPDGAPGYVPISARWAHSARAVDSSAPVPAAAEPSAAEKPAEGAAPQPVPGAPKLPGHVTPERKERLEKAFRPPPNVPDDL